MHKTLPAAIRQIKAKPIPVYLLLLSALLINAFLLFIIPVYFNSERTMVLIAPFKKMLLVGTDLRVTLSYARMLFSPNLSMGSAYPPFARIALFPLSQLPFMVAYVILVCEILAIFFVTTFVIPRALSRGRARACSIILTLAGLSSYGLHFALERGQFDIIAICLALSAVCMYHYSSARYRLPAFVLFTIAVQLKAYPAIFGILLFTPNDTWKRNVLQWVFLGAANIACLFLAGFNNFLLFLHNITRASTKPYLWDGNHSIKSFFYTVSQSQFSSFEHIGASVSIALFAAILIGLFVMWVYKKEQAYIKYILMLATVGSMIIPAESQDYKLPFIIAAYAIFISLHVREQGEYVRGLFRSVLHFSLAFWVCWTLFPGPAKPSFLLMRNNFPALMIIACLVGISALYDWLGPVAPARAAEERC